MSTSSVSFVEPQELAQWLKTDNSGTIVIDVRDTDFTGNRIPGSRNMPANQFIENVDILIENLQQQEPKPNKIVFHCQHSKERGPNAARLFRKKSLNALPSIEVYNLHGGFHEYEQIFKDDETMLEKIF
ncbi:MAG: hypothetical protein EZS28_015727 [Streblomastix strix]|uniref:Rhodanese domain-containing protein n=1 Tax=Streblomastix strix TaxID=222440 RepID=A0A5J4W1I8_9EUKA|nr:MAG: hypothetical protein EZS28_015727 [Streblomastix strix]